MTLRLPILIALATLTAGCGNKGGDALPAPSGSAATAKVVAAGATIDAMARAASACQTYESGGFDASCPAYKTWSEAKDAFTEGKGDAALVALLGDADAKVRYLAASKLNQYGTTFRSDRALAAGVVAAAEREKSAFSGSEVGAAAGHVRVRDTGTFGRIEAMVNTQGVPELRRGILSNLLYNNQDDDPVFDLVRGATKDADSSVAMTALKAFWTGGMRKADRTCQLYAENTDNGNDDLAAEASNDLAWFGKCASRYDGLLDSLERRVKAGSLSSTSYVTAARHVCEDAGANDKQRKRAAALGRRMVGKKDFKAWIRVSALETVIKCDAGNGGRSFVGGFKGDTDKAVADKARELLARK